MKVLKIIITMVIGVQFLNATPEKISEERLNSIYVYQDEYKDASKTGSELEKEDNKVSLYSIIKSKNDVDKIYQERSLGVGVGSSGGVSASLGLRKEVTLADISYNLGCSDKTMGLQKSAPLLRNYVEQVKIYAPTAVNPFTNEIDSKELFMTTLELMGEEEQTEKYLDFLAYIHYTIQSSLNTLNDPENQPPQDNMFRKAEFSACMGSTMANSIEEELNFGVGENSYDDESFKYGLDVTAFAKAYSCYDRREGAVVKGENEQKRYEYSKFYIKSLFDKFMAGQFTFTKKSSKLCEDLHHEMEYNQPVNKTEKIEILRASKLGQIEGFDGGITTIGLEHESKYHLEPTGGQAGSVSAKMDPSSVSILESYSADPSGNAVSGGELRSVRDTDFKTRVIYQATPQQIDIMDIPEITKLKFLESVKTEFLENIGKSEFYHAMSSKTKMGLSLLMDRVTSQLELDPERLRMLSCSLNENNCDFPWITEVEYKRFVDNNGEGGICEEKSSNGEYCVKYKPNQSLQIRNILDDLKTVATGKQKIYIRKLIEQEIGSQVEEYYRAAGGLVFSSDFDGLQNNKEMFAIETGKRKIELLKTGVLIKNKWLSPISKMADTEKKLIEDRFKEEYEKTKANDISERAKMYQNIKKIAEQNGDNRVNYTSYLYRPLNELEVAKQLFSMADSIKIFQVLNKEVSKPSFLELEPAKWATKQKDDFVLEQLEGLGLSSYYGNTNFPMIEIKDGKQQFKSFPATITNYEAPASSFIITAEEVANINLIFSNFSDFYISRLKELYGKRIAIVKGELLERMEKYKMDKTNLEILEAEIEKIDFKMEQRVNMLNLLKRR